MKLVFEKSSLLKAVNIVLKAVPSKTTLNILECILIDATAEEITFTTNDMELGIETKVKGEIIEHGMIAINAKTFSDIIHKLPDNDVMLVTDENHNSIITCEKSKFTIPYREGDEFSRLPYIEKNNPIVFNQFRLKEIIRQTIFSTSDNDIKRVMSGELFEVKENMLRVVSLDGHRMSMRRVEVEDHGNTVKAVIPGKTLNEMLKILSSNVEDSLNLYFTNNHVLFEFEDTMVVSRLIEGEFFNIDQMITRDYETKAVVNKKEFLNCIDRASLMIKEGDKKPIVMQLSDGNLELKVNSPMGSMNEDLDITKEGRDLMICFNPRFLMDVLRNIDEEEVSIYMMSAKTPAIIRNEDFTYLYLILPVNFSQM